MATDHVAGRPGGTTAESNVHTNAVASGNARQHNGNVYNHNTYIGYSVRKQRSIETLSEHTRSKLLLQVAAEGQTRRLEFLIRSGADIDYTDENELTALHHAALNGYEDCVEVLLHEGADVNAVSRSHGTALCLAAVRSRHNVVKLLVRPPYRARIDAPGGYLGSALHAACRVGQMPIMKTLFEYGANVNAICTIQLGFTYALHMDKSLPIINYPYEHVISPLGLAAMLGFAPMLLYLLDKDASIDLVYEERALRKSGGVAAANDPDYRANALIFAARQSKDEAVRALLQYRVDPNVQDSQGSTALLCAARNGHSRILKDLISHGASLDVKNAEGNTAVILAANSGHDECVRILAKAGADLEISGRKKNTALLAAANSGQVGAVKVLIEFGVDLDCHNNAGNTAVMVAAIKGHDDCVSVLLAKGAAAHANG